ncbi:uncharacterized protein LOC110228855 [Arabidopsis lyrata subsp. lyrata]|uniref:uncharacterized protein LOC110228855 n=1 Tax=Arabidopsis lyrata subsp. lyrata TaxID=81972 RepID=UPI000A29E230|nr:uncharacterized protein LOC110228855 [Arabidopsis lyrata subsp. lyrata]|eukprot:XP_020882722.1 uncharacterized protein LOC110228855 [Arabidopsis lyrata subsp. lyrata]
MVEHYEKLLLSRGHEIDTWKGKLSALEADLHSSSNSKHELEDRVDNLTSELAKVRGELQDQYDRSSQLQDEFSGVQGRLYESEATAYSLNNQLAELDAKYKAIKARSVLESDIKEYESNLLLLEQTHEEGFSEEQERSELTASLAEKRSHLAALHVPAFNPQQFEEFFTESPPLSKSGLDWAGKSFSRNSPFTCFVYLVNRTHLSQVQASRMVLSHLRFLLYQWSPRKMKVP